MFGDNHKSTTFCLKIANEHYNGDQMEQHHIFHSHVHSTFQGENAIYILKLSTVLLIYFKRKIMILGVYKDSQIFTLIACLAKWLFKTNRCLWIDRGFKPRSGQTKYYKIGICCFSAKHTDWCLGEYIGMERHVYRRNVALAS